MYPNMVDRAGVEPASQAPVAPTAQSAGLASPSKPRVLLKAVTIYQLQTAVLPQLFLWELQKIFAFVKPSLRFCIARLDRTKNRRSAIELDRHGRQESVRGLEAMLVLTDTWHQ
jgi:hypothetical protein